MIELSTIEAPPIELERTPTVEALSPLMQSIARNYIGARARAGGAILDAARYLAEARHSAKYGEWGVFLESTGTAEDTANRMIAIATRADADQHYARAISDGRLAFTAAFELLSAPAETQQRALESDVPTPASAIRADKQAEKLRTSAEFLPGAQPTRPNAPQGWAWRDNNSMRHIMSGVIITRKETLDATVAAAEQFNAKREAAAPIAHPDREHQSAVERILRDATTPEQIQEAYTHARQATSVDMYNKLMGMVDQALDGTIKEDKPTVPDAPAEAVAQRTPPDLIAAGVEMRRHGIWYVAHGARGLMRGWVSGTAAPFERIVEQARGEIAHRTPPPAVTQPEPEVIARLPAVPPRPKRPVSADVSAQVAYMTQLETYASALESVIQALQKQIR